MLINLLHQFAKQKQSDNSLFVEPWTLGGYSHRVCIPHVRHVVSTCQVPPDIERKSKLRAGLDDKKGMWLLGRMSYLWTNQQAINRLQRMSWLEVWNSESELYFFTEESRKIENFQSEQYFTERHLFIGISNFSESWTERHLGVEASLYLFPPSVNK